MQAKKDQLFAALTAAGMPPVPEEFSVVSLPQVIPETTLIHTFERVTTRPRWQEAVVTVAPEIARFKRADCYCKPGGLENQILAECR